MAHKIQVKRGNKANLPTLDAGEFGLCQDTNELFIGNNGNKKIFPAETPEISETYTTTLDTTWSGTKAPYTKEQTVTGILSTDNPIVDIVLSGTYATDSKIEADWAEIYRIVTSTNSVTLYAHKKPTNSIPLQFKVVR